MTEAAPFVSVHGLSIGVTAKPGKTGEIVSDISFDLKKGEVLALIGESGSGKTTIALSLMGYVRGGAEIRSGSVTVGDTDLTRLSKNELNALRGDRVAYVAQSAAAAFNPAFRIITQVVESAMIHGTMTAEEARRKARALFREFALPDPDNIGNRYPHEVSGGQLQRMIAAMALINDPDLIILDEPTTALDVTTQIEVLREFKRAVKQRNATAVYVSHDLAVVAQMADRIVVLKDGRIQEQHTTRQVLTEPESPYTGELLAAAEPQKRVGRPTPADGRGWFRIEGIEGGYGRVNSEGEPHVKVLRDIDFTIGNGEAVGVIGESGSGKSTLAQVIAGTLPASSGRLSIGGEALPVLRSEGGRSKDQRRKVQMVVQFADTALNPAHSISTILERPLKFFGLGDRVWRRKRVSELLDMVHLPEALAERTPAELSGGQKQRVNLARALAAEPALLVCDEVTSALDTVVASAILDLLAELRRELGLSMMFISHDLSTVTAICDRVVVLYGGMVAEVAGCDTLSSVLMHPYTELLVSSIPELRTDWLDGVDVRRDALRAFDQGKPACRFATRCPYFVPNLCEAMTPPQRALTKNSVVACHLEEDELTRLMSPVAAE